MSSEAPTVGIKWELLEPARELGCRRSMIRTPRSIVVVVFLFAFALRLAWILRVQHPIDAIYSDMAGYVDRAEGLVFHVAPPDPRLLAIYPWGTHALVALEFVVLGRHAETSMAIFYALLGAVPAACMVVLTVHLVPSRLVAAFVGALVAIWPPQIAFAAFFLSEPWFAAAIAVQAVLTVRDWRRPYGLLAVGAISSIAFVVRPQFILTWGFDLVSRAFSLVRRRGLRRTAGALFWICLPVALAAGGSAVRLHHLSGHWGLISANDQMTRLWADTDVCMLRSHWKTAEGRDLYWWFSPPSKPVRNARDVAEFEGFIADPDILRRIRKERLQGVTLTARLARTWGNEKLLFTGNLPWPESNYKEPSWRFSLMEWSAAAMLYAILPFAALGALLGRKNRTLWIATTGLATMLFCAALFFGEARYHVPYDPFAILLAVTGCCEIARRTTARLGRFRRGRRSAERAQADHPRAVNSPQLAGAARYDAQPRANSPSLGPALRVLGFVTVHNRP
jgi:hypothetical protein